MDPIKEAFSKIKEEIIELREEIYKIKEEISLIPTNQQTQNPTQIPENNVKNTIPTNQQTQNPTQIPENNVIQSLYSINSDISIGNEGVPTDKQTNEQTNQQTQNPINYNIKSNFQEINEILESLDSIKKEIRLKFKRLTTQEMLVFSHLYSLEEQNTEEITYKILSKIMNLSESSIRDYINKLISKGIPVEKLKQNNKIILLKISKDLKKVTNLATIQALRDI